MALAAGEFAQTIADLSTSDVGLGVQLAGALVGLAAVERKAQELQDKQANEDTLTIMSTGEYLLYISYAFHLDIPTADEYARLINSVRVSENELLWVYVFSSEAARWRSVHGYECTMPGKRLTVTPSGQSRHMTATVPKAVSPTNS